MNEFVLRVGGCEEMSAIGDVSARNRAIEASTSGGAIDISVAGNLSTNGYGIFARSEAMAGAITIDTQGTISAGLTGIYVHSQEGGDLNVTVDANITAGHQGIYADSPLSAQNLTGDWVFDVTNINTPTSAG